jgi:hypothetical protein
MKGLIKMEWKGMELFSMARDRERWRTDVNTAINLHFPYIVGVSLPAETLLG